MKDYYASLDKTTEIETTNSVVTTKNNKTTKNSGIVYHKIRRGETLGLIAAKYGVGVNQLRDWNNISGNKIMAGKNLRIYPEGTSNNIAVNETNTTTKNNIYKYKVKRGDNLSEISEKFGVTVQQVKKWNNISGDKIAAGKTLKIYNSTKTSSYGDNTTKNSSNINYYKIKPGDSIGGIAEKYGVKASDIRNWNNISGNKILAGNTLKIYSDANINDIPNETTKNIKSSKQSYTVKSGDSLYSIASKNNTTVAKLKSINNLTSNKIKAGQKIRLN